MSRGAVLELEKQAGDIRGLWPSYDSDVKCWYNPRFLFDQQAQRVLVGINPRDEPESRYGEDHSYLNHAPTPMPYTEWIDGRWPGRGAQHQRKVQRVFRYLYGNGEWERKLRTTPSFNVCPLRTHDAGDIPANVWEASVDWFILVLAYLKPKTIICNSSSTSGRSPWAVINDRLYIADPRQLPDQGRADLRWGTINGLVEGGTTVIGFNQRASNDLWGYLRGLKGKINYS